MGMGNVNYKTDSISIEEDNPKKNLSLIEKNNQKIEQSPRPKIEPSPRPKIEPSPRPKIEQSPRPKIEQSPRPKIEPSPRSKIKPLDVLPYSTITDDQRIESLRRIKNNSFKNPCEHCEKMDELIMTNSSKVCFPGPESIFDHNTEDCEKILALLNHYEILFGFNQMLGLKKIVMHGAITNHIVIDNLAFIFYINQNELAHNSEPNIKTNKFRHGRESNIKLNKFRRNSEAQLGTHKFGIGIKGPFIFFIHNDKTNYKKCFYESSSVTISLYINNADNWLHEVYFVHKIKKTVHRYNENDFRYVKKKFL